VLIIVRGKLGKLVVVGEIILKWCFKEIIAQGVNWISLTQDRDM
jgi:hypothetical protein